MAITGFLIALVVRMHNLCIKIKKITDTAGQGKAQRLRKTCM